MSNESAGIHRVHTAAVFHSVSHRLERSFHAHYSGYLRGRRGEHAPSLEGSYPPANNVIGRTLGQRIPVFASTGVTRCDGHTIFRGVVRGPYKVKVRRIQCVRTFTYQGPQISGVLYLNCGPQIQYMQGVCGPQFSTCTFTTKTRDQLGFPLLDPCNLSLSKRSIFL